jgi:hypothetical protein
MFSSFFLEKLAVEHRFAEWSEPIAAIQVMIGPILDCRLIFADSWPLRRSGVAS